MNPISLFGTHVLPLGLVIDAVFVILLYRTFRWMFRAPRPLPQAVVSIQRTVNRVRKIVVPVKPTVASTRAVELAARLAEPQKASLLLLAVVEVPYSLPLSAYSPRDRERCEAALAVAREMLRAHEELPVETEVVPGRTAGEAILRVVKDRGADLVVMGMETRPGRARELSSTVQYVLQRAPCEVIVDRAPAAVHGAVEGAVPLTAG